MTTPIFFLFFLYAFVLAKRSMKKIDTLHNNFLFFSEINTYNFIEFIPNITNALYMYTGRRIGLRDIGFYM
jgi:hypothetical protein